MEIKAGLDWAEMAEGLEKFHTSLLSRERIIKFVAILKLVTFESKIFDAEKFEV